MLFDICAKYAFDSDPSFDFSPDLNTCINLLLYCMLLYIAVKPAAVDMWTRPLPHPHAKHFVCPVISVALTHYWFPSNANLILLKTGVGYFYYALLKHGNSGAETCKAYRRRQSLRLILMVDPHKQPACQLYGFLSFD